MLNAIEDHLESVSINFFVNIGQFFYLFAYQVSFGWTLDIINNTLYIYKLWNLSYFVEAFGEWEWFLAGFFVLMEPNCKISRVRSVQQLMSSIGWIFGI